MDKQNYRYWAPEYPQRIHHETPLYDQRTHYFKFRRLIMVDSHPTLHHLIFFHWGYIKEKVCINRLQTICVKIARMAARIMENFLNRLTRCIENKGRHLDDVVFHK